jgi:hypothetical protein
MAISKAIQSVGQGIMNVGLGLLFVSAVVGSISLDIVILCAILSGKTKSSSQNAFVTGYMLGAFSSRDNNRFSSSLSVLFISSLIITAIAIALALTYGMPVVAGALVLTWLVPAAITLIGATVEFFGKLMEKVSSPAATVPMNTYHQPSYPQNPTSPNEPSVYQHPAYTTTHPRYDDNKAAHYKLGAV